MFRIFGDIPVEPFEPPVEPTAAPSPIWWILGAVVAVAAVTAVVIVILMNKKKKGGQ